VAAGVEGRRAPRFALSPRARSLRGLWLLGVSLTLAGCSYDVTLGNLTTYALAATTSGTWDSSGVHATGVYFVGHTTDPPDDTLSYFVFDLTPVAGKTVTDASLTLPGTSDWKITVPGTQPLALQFKLGATPLPASLTLAQVTGGSDDTSVYPDVSAEQDLGFAWVPSGSTTNTYGAFTYDTTRLQDAVNAGGLYPIFAVQRFGQTATTAEYLYGGGVFGPGIVLDVTVE
jgi:hypothetical protein